METRRFYELILNMKNLVAYFPQFKRNSERGKASFYKATGTWDFTGMLLRNQKR